jgi:hypothetical protein
MTPNERETHGRPRASNGPSHQVTRGFTAILMLGIAGLAWFVGRDDPVPAWITDLLIPVLSVLVLILVAILILDWVRQRRRG